MTNPVDSIEALITALRAEASLPGRVRLLAQSWRMVRGLGPTDRHRVALALGSKWAWKHLERTFSADGELSEGEALVKQALKQVGESDPSELRETVRLVRSGRHKEAGSRFLQLLEAAVVLPTHGEGSEVNGLAEGETAAERESAAAAAELPETTADSADEARGVPDEWLAEAQAEESVEATGSTPESGTREKSVVPEAGARESRPPDPAPAEHESPRRAPVVPKPTPGARRRRATGRSRAVTPEPAPPEDPVAPLLDAFVMPTATAVSGVAALRLLRRLNRGGVQVAGSAQQRRDLVARAGSGWAARRALSQMIQGGMLTDVDEALALIASIESGAQKTWALGDLIECLDLDEGAADRILDAAPSDAARRRLARRVGR